MDTALPAATATPPPPMQLTRRRKAAIIVRLLLSEGADIPLDTLPGETQAALTSEIAAMRYIDGGTLRVVVGEFLQALDQVGLAFPGGLDGALSLLDGHLSDETRAELLASRPGAGPPDPWVRIAAMEAEQLLPLTLSESTEVAAVLLSKLSTAKAAELLSRLPGERARRIALAVSQTGRVSPHTVARIGETVLELLQSAPTPAFTEAPEARIGAILNIAPAATRDDVLSGLESADAGFAQRVKKKIFTFADIPTRVVDRDVPAITRAVAPDDLVTAIAAADGGEADAAEFILANMSQRMAASLREEAAERGAVSTREAEAAMAAVVAAIRALEADGALSLILPDEAA